MRSLPVIFLKIMPKEGSQRLGISIKKAPEDHNSTFLQLLSLFVEATKMGNKNWSKIIVYLCILACVSTPSLQFIFKGGGSY